MTLDLTRNAKTAIVPCLPCCNTGYQNCACGVNEKLNTLGGKNANGETLDKSHPANFVTLFIKDLFVGESSVANKGERTDAIYQDGMAPTGVTCDDKVWTFSFPATPRTLQAQTRFYADKYEGRLVIDGVDSGWVELSKTYGTEYLTTLQGTISGFDIISHSMCVCRGDINSPGNVYPPDMKETSIGIKPYYVTFSGLPAHCGSSFRINKANLAEPYPLANGADLAIHHENYPISGALSVSAGPDWHLDCIMTFSSQANYTACAGVTYSIAFGWTVDSYTRNGDYTNQANYGNKAAATFTATTTTAYGGNPPGTTHWMNGGVWFLYLGIPALSSNFPGHLPDVSLLAIPDFSFPMKIDFEPFYYEYTAYGFDRSKTDYNLGIHYNHTSWDGEIFSPKVIITE